MQNLYLLILWCCD